MSGPSSVLASLWIFWDWLQPPSGPECKRSSERKMDEKLSLDLNAHTPKKIVKTLSKLDTSAFTLNAVLKLR